MYKTDGLDIIVPKGDSAELAFRFTEADGETPYMIGSDKLLRFEVYTVSDKATVIEKSVGGSEQEADGTIIIPISPSDTDIPRHRYIYMLRIAESTDIVDTILGIDETVSLYIK